MAVFDWLQQLLGGGDPEAQGAAAASTAIQPATSALGQGVYGAGQAIGGDIGDMLNALWSGTVKMPGEILAGERAPTVADTTSFALNTLPVRGVLGTIKAYHGSPYDFAAEPGYPLGRFRDDKIGSGEGAQAIAYGHYSGEAEGVGQTYRDALSQPALQIGDQKIIPPRGSPEDIALAHLESAFYDQSSSPYAKALQSLRVARDLTPETPTMTARNTMESAMKVLSDWQEQGAKPSSAGKMYELNINAEPDQFLQWDKPATEQPPNVMDALNKIWQDRGGTLEGRQYPPFAAHPDATGESLHSALATTLGSKEAAAAALRDAGVPGVRYLDQGSRGAGQGTSNYVVFDPKIIEILRKYGIIPPAVGAGLLGAADQQ